MIVGSKSPRVQEDNGGLFISFSVSTDKEENAGTSGTVLCCARTVFACSKPDSSSATAQQSCRSFV